jgi:hypothetical protein
MYVEIEQMPKILVMMMLIQEHLLLMKKRSQNQNFDF